MKRVYKVQLGNGHGYFRTVIRKSVEAIKKEALVIYPLATVTVTFMPKRTESEASKLMDAYIEYRYNF